MKPTTFVKINSTSFFISTIAFIILNGVLDNAAYVGILSLFISFTLISTYEIHCKKIVTRATTGISNNTVNFDYKRVLTKLYGLYAKLIIIWSLYWQLLSMAPARFNEFLSFLTPAFAFTAIFAIPYVLFVDSRMIDPYDGYWHFGRLLLGHLKDKSFQKIRNHLLGWSIKAFYLPIMVSGYFYTCNYLSTSLEKVNSLYFLDILPLLFTIILFIDLQVAVLGYVCTFRILDAHIRSCNPIFFGWIVTLICYYPFWGLIYPNLVSYNNGENWNFWFAQNPFLLNLWGLMLLGAKCTWLWANMTFGLRFSNLTHRGILTTGPFRYTKHPSYLSKNIFYWLSSLPFLSSKSLDEAIINSLALLSINFIYYCRAKAEERHLMEDPQYVCYNEWIKKNGIIGMGKERLKRFFNTDETEIALLALRNVKEKELAERQGFKHR